MTEGTTTIETVAAQQHALASASADVGLSIESLVARVDKIKQVQARVMREGHHYGSIPGVDRPTLLQPGAQMLCLTFQLAPSFQLEERADGEHLEVIAHCTLTHAPTGTKVGEGIGSCTTRESRYAYRKGERTCPECGSAALRKSKNEPEWFCWRKIGGCGATFELDDKRITAQTPDRIENPDIADTYNTVRKMATKRALVAATLLTTCASDLFTQDAEDMPEAHPKPKAQAKGADTDLFLRLSEAIANAEGLADLERVAAELRQVRERKTLPPEPFKRLRTAWESRRAQLERAAGFADAEYEDIEREAIAEGG